jgi:hypothetical protein
MTKEACLGWLKDLASGGEG